ncbi:glutamate ABC transporter substrate-binding protein [Blastococcus saxobsidens]|uniref:Extracellular amino acid ABC transporter substrate-binding protein, PAAT family n=1 Tax=Blastococcus saxobsidens (strain DD2) TaxID=1146883 RepID=H6RVQ7_BLASD|nr:glutamate ABC transporter substrate-binding protein [Blastococcus saxobsidens]CCG04537.1 Extracellular amino acid ABC transporter substrate-binding protein, PAAT family [Blastococcus saxobsidens DD2]
MSFRRGALVATLSVVALTAAACGGDDEVAAPEPDVAEAPEFEAGTTMAEIAESGSITVGTKFDQPGFGLETLDGELEGFDVEIAKIIAAELGIAPEDITWEQTPSAVREEVIEGGEVDMVVATYTINDERAERITFAGPYYEAGQQIMVAADNDTITGPESFTENPDATVCSVTGSTPSEQIREYLASDSQLVLFDEYSQCADALSNGQVDAVTTDNVILLGFVSESDGEFKLVGEQFTEEPYGIGIEKGDVAFCEFINETLAANEEAYVAAWEATAGQIEGTQTPELPEPAECV